MTDMQRNVVQFIICAPPKQYVYLLLAVSPAILALLN